MDWAQLLVIILAVLFAVFLALAIALAFLLVSITRQIKVAVASAERTVSVIEGVVTQYNKAALPMMVTRKIIKQIINTSQKKRKETKT